MADPTTRTLKLLALLQAHRLWGAAELADRLSTTERTVRRDVDRLRELGYPVQAIRGNGGGYQLAAGASMPPLVVDEEEAVAIVAALRGAASGSAAGLAEASVRALAKVTQVLPPKLRRRADALAAMSVAESGYAAPQLEAEWLTTVALACRDTVELTFDYEPRAGRAAGGRRVEPLRLVPVARRWYLLAYDLDRGDWRTFRVDRLSNPKPGRRVFRPRAVPGGDPAAYVRESLRAAHESHEVRVLVHAPPERVRESIGRWAQVEPTPDGALVTMRVEDVRWVALAVGGLDADYEFVAIPPDLLRSIRGRNAREARALYLAE
ncbi:WYL domain-containing protein [Gordonia sp. X0973]|uniref:helix-turn-helix transcriptional regulator n=1 Tax=Gordonia sp. X0973 TaxID=2742602 RepID=UPI000F51AFF7|nr:WYL domain-containing protein [Gordonia sp. X0973]QKT06001.1 WYL domain-containing protein [Gordonia sp. X0973]